MGKRRAEVFSLSWPVHWIIHTKCFLLKKEQGRDDVAQSGCSVEMPLAGASGTAVGKEDREGIGIRWQQGVFENLFSSAQCTTCFGAPKPKHELDQNLIISRLSSPRST